MKNISNCIPILNQMRTVTSFIISISLFPSVLMANFSFQNAPLNEVIREIQRETDYYFLYRESQIADIRITLETSQDRVIEDLESALTSFGIQVRLDQTRNQVFLTRIPETASPTRRIHIKGQIVDANTGERLPNATLSWMEKNRVTGTASNKSGVFTIRRSVDRDFLEIKASYIGYREREFRLDLTESNRFEDLTIRLEPEPVKGNEIIVSGFSGFNPSDTLLAGMIDAGRFSPLGETNSIRALQSHPSVSNGPALNNGLNVRGSTPDGFLVLLDGMSIFNQSHLFGLLDSFNEDAIQSSGYYFGVTPANIETPTGGTLNLITRTGSRSEFRGKAGVSNTSVNATFEGPLGSRSSWLLSARTSYMDQVSWFNNPDLIQWGLDINRPRRIATTGPDFTDLVLRPGAASARFVDLHAKVYHETTNAGRFIFSGYLGGDETFQTAERRTRTAGSEGEFVFEQVQTSNLWGNTLLSLKYEQEFFNRLFSSTSAGFSAYETEFDKDDFVYARVSSSENNESVTIFTHPFSNRSSMNEFKVKQELEYRLETLTTSVGGSWRYFRGEYGESSFDRPSFFRSTEAHLGDFFVQAEWSPISLLQISTGGRFYFYSPENNILASPRVYLRIKPSESFQLFGGYSVNHQFLHRVSLENATTADVWILSSEEQPPASSTQYTAGIELYLFANSNLKIEAYQKRYENLRIHELNTQTLENTFSGTPWFIQNSGDAKGLEVILRNRWNRFTLTQSYTLSRMTFRNPSLLDGREFFADWDRTHSYNAVLETAAWNNLRLFLSLTLMSGTPNSLSTFGNDTTERLDSYKRIDSSLKWNRNLLDASNLEISASIFNLLNRDNVWYRNYAFNFDETRSVPRLRPVPVDVLDLGIQPSFSIKYSF